MKDVDHCAPYRFHGFCSLADFLGCSTVANTGHCPRSASEARRAATAVRLVESYRWLKWKRRNERLRILLILAGASDGMSWPLRSYLFKRAGELLI